MTYVNLLFRKEFLQAHGETNTDRYKVALLAEKTGGIYDIRVHRGMHRGAAKVK